MQDAQDRNAVRAGQIEDQKLLKPANPPFAQPGQLRRAQEQRGAHAGIPGQICEARVGIRQEPFCGLEVGMLAQVHVLTRSRLAQAAYEPWPRQSFFLRRLSCARASLRISSKSCFVSSLSSLSSPSSNNASSRSSALRFSSSRISSRMYSLTLL